MKLRITILALMALVLVGCPREKRALEASRKAVEVAAMTVDLVDQQVASLFLEASSAALEACETRTCYRDLMRKWDKAVIAVVGMKSSLHLVETSLDAWEAGSPIGQSSLLGAAACFLDSLSLLQDLLSDLDVSAPALNHGLDYVDALFGLSGTACPQGASA